MKITRTEHIKTQPEVRCDSDVEDITEDTAFNQV